MRAVYAADTPEGARIHLLADAAELRRDMDDAKIDDIQITIWTKLAVRGTLESIVRQLGRRPCHFVKRKGHNLSSAHVDTNHLEPRGNRGMFQRGDRRQ